MKNTFAHVSHCKCKHSSDDLLDVHFTWKCSEKAERIPIAQENSGFTSAEMTCVQMQKDKKCIR